MIRLIYNDCLKVMDKMIERKEQVDLIVTDPPYLINYKTNRRKNKKHDFCIPIKGDNSEELIIKFIEKSYFLLKENTAMYMFCNQDRVDFFRQQLKKYFKIKNMIIWVKNNWTAGDLQAQFGKRYEIVFLLNKGRKKINGKRLDDVWFYNKIMGKKQLHQNQKPIDLIKQMIEKHSCPEDLVFDGFMGSGTTGVACVEMDRNFIGVEIDQGYFQICRQRIKRNQKLKLIKEKRKRSLECCEIAEKRIINYKKMSYNLKQ